MFKDVFVAEALAQICCTNWICLPSLLLASKAQLEYHAVAMRRGTRRFQAKNV